jgi:hypothetical protein
MTAALTLAAILIPAAAGYVAIVTVLGGRELALLRSTFARGGG